MSSRNRAQLGEPQHVSPSNTTANTDSLSGGFAFSFLDPRFLPGRILSVEGSMIDAGVHVFCLNWRRKTARQRPRGLIVIVVC